MRKEIWAAALLALTPSVCGHEGHGGAGHEHAAAAGATSTIEGKVIDLACYMSSGEMSDEHSKCAKACVLGGAPAGVLAADGSLTLLVEDHANAKPYHAAQKLAGGSAKVTGRLAKKGGLQALIVTAAEKR